MTRGILDTATGIIFFYICCQGLYVVGENVANHIIGGRDLVAIGREVENPLIRLLGTVIINLEDKYDILKEKYIKITELLCRLYKGYTNTHGGFCLKIYLDKMSRNDAEDICRSDGGYLVNIDSMQKVHDVEDLLQKHSINSSGLWIDGIRSQSSFLWRYNAQPTDPSFTYWDEVQGEPHLRPDQLCKIFYFGQKSKVWRWHDGGCVYSYIFACEILRQ